MEGDQSLNGTAVSVLAGSAAEVLLSFPRKLDSRPAATDNCFHTSAAAPF